MIVYMLNQKLYFFITLLLSAKIGMTAIDVSGTGSDSTSSIIALSYRH